MPINGYEDPATVYEEMQMEENIEMLKLRHMVQTMNMVDELLGLGGKKPKQGIQDERYGNITLFPQRRTETTGL